MAKTQMPSIDFNAITGNGTKESPLMYQGKKYTGTIPWSTGPAKYVNGIKLTATKNPTITPDSDGTISTTPIAEPTIDTTVTGPIPTTATAVTETTTTGPTAYQKFGIGEALLADKIYGAELQKVFNLWKAGKLTEAEDLYNKTKWARLDSDARNRYLLQIENSDIYAERLREWGIGLRKLLAQQGLQITDEKLKDYFDRGIDEQVIVDELIGGITTKGAAGVSGSALEDLRATARNNGFNLEKDFGNQVDGWLQRIARGESVEDFKRLIRQQAKLGLPDKVGALLDEGLDLANVYSPYRNAMSKLLEISPDSISLDDPILRSAYAGDKEMSVYEFSRAVRKDPRWQYTDNARQEVSDSVLGVLRDFGFQG